MPRGVHTSKRKSGFQQRKAKQARLDVAQSMSGSIFKYVTKTDDSPSSSKEPDFHLNANARDDLDNISSYSGSNIDSTELINTNEEDADDADDSSTIIATNKPFPPLNDASEWSIPVPYNVCIKIIKTNKDHLPLFLDTEPK
ncbi:unnamed protein product [Parnassius apollo]|uniref:(apollo) hypothetical protein n=1 Tax=Parnassius apollo TaxID=110799 RepID=A0A8S3Y743_PARAO|nr:unnamed protein product [Parnassius apollo]